jgi:hypothetical protein
MQLGGVSPIENPRHETGFAPPTEQQKPKPLDRLAGALRSYNHLNGQLFWGFHGRGLILPRCQRQPLTRKPDKRS